MCDLTASGRGVMGPMATDTPTDSSNSIAFNQPNVKLVLSHVGPTNKIGISLNRADETKCCNVPSSSATSCGNRLQSIYHIPVHIRNGASCPVTCCT